MRNFEIRITASPTRAFFGQVAMFVAALTRLGYSAKDTTVRIFLGAATNDEIDPVWQCPLPPLVELIWCDPAKVDAIGILAQCEEAFLNSDYSAPVVLFCDADTLWLHRIDDLIAIVAENPNAAAGFIAHYPPPGHEEYNSSSDFWKFISTGVIARHISLQFRHSIKNDTPCPFYINFGFVAVNVSVLSGNEQRMIEMCRASTEFIRNPYFQYQVGFALFCEIMNVGVIALPAEYNFINDELFARLYNYENAKIIHYLRSNTFNRDEIFLDRQTIGGFLSLDLQGIEKLFQLAVKDIINNDTAMNEHIKSVDRASNALWGYP